MTPEVITSRSNPKIKFLRSLRQRKTRQATGLFLIEGIRHVGEAVQNGAPLHSLYYAPELLTSQFAKDLIADQQASGSPCYAVSPEVFAGLAEKDHPQGLVALCRWSPPPLETRHRDNFRWGVALISPQDPGNIGTILRTIDAVGASGLLLLEDSADPTSSACVRASMGTLFHLPVVQASFDAFLAWAQQHRYTLYGTSARAGEDFRQIAYQPPAILLLGSERAGLTPQQTAVCHHLVTLPMYGRATSLNLAVATGVMLYQMQTEMTKYP